MRTDALDLEIGDTQLRVICEDQDGVALLRTALKEHLVVEAAPLGFVLRSPQNSDRFFVLLDRSGFVLARSRTLDESLAILASHLAVFQPSPSGTTRMKMRALVSDDSTAVLAQFPIFVSPPLVERRLGRTGHRIVDSLAIDVANDGSLQMSPAQWPDLTRMPSPQGHASAPSEPHEIVAALALSPTNHPPSRGALTWMFATGMDGNSSRSERLTLAERLSGVRALPVLPAQGSSAYAALQVLALQ